VRARSRSASEGLSKKGDRYLRSLLVNGAMAVVRQAKIRPDKHPWLTKLLGRMSAKQASIAIANKTARTQHLTQERRPHMTHCLRNVTARDEPC
jgi:transposase